MRRVLTYISVAYLALWSVIFPPKAQALTVNSIKCEEIPNKYWTASISRAYARAMSVQRYGWGRTEYKALNKLWTTESHWNPSAYNKEVGDPTDGSHAGGIPQILALDPRTPAPVQIDRGLAYIHHRYGKPSIAWSYHRTHGWY
jgi:hypothetical protein